MSDKRGDIINEFKQRYLEETGEELNIDLSKALKCYIDKEDEAPSRAIRLNFPSSGFKS